MNKKVILYPEVLAAVIKNKEEDIFCLWLIAKKIDYDNKGIVNQNELLNIAKLTLGLNSTHTYTKISKGIDKYWRKPFGKNGKKILGLISIDKIVDRLKPDITKVKPVVVDLNIFKADGKNLKNIRNLFISIVAGRYHDNRPLSMYSLIHNLGLSENTIRNAIKNNSYLKINSNYKVLLKNSDKQEIDKLKRINKNPLALSVISKDGIFCLLEQIGNSYELIDFERISMKKRPRSLKNNDKRMLDLLFDNRYNSNDNSRTFDKSLILSF